MKNIQIKIINFFTFNKTEKILFNFYLLYNNNYHIYNKFFQQK